MPAETRCKLPLAWHKEAIRLAIEGAGAAEIAGRLGKSKGGVIKLLTGRLRGLPPEKLLEASLVYGRCRHCGGQGALTNPPLGLRCASCCRAPAMPLLRPWSGARARAAGIASGAARRRQGAAWRRRAAELAAAGWSMRSIGAALGKHASTISRALKWAEFRLPRRGKAPPAGKRTR